ncbi:MAG: hypothetical protein AAF434_02220 [Pseudomonadota bacterium]
MARERSFRAVPRIYLGALFLALALQIVFAQSRNASHWVRSPDVLPAAPSEAVARIAALGEPRYLSHAMSAWLQTFDYQSGVSVAWHALDYDRVIGWLSLQQQLDPDNPFPMLAAAHIYGGVFDKPKIRQMVDFITESFARDPKRHWRWMASAAITARHRLDDIDLAIALARDLDLRTRGVPIHAWARQLHFIITLQTGEADVAAAILKALMQSGELTDQNQIRFLQKQVEWLRKNDEISSSK